MSTLFLHSSSRGLPAPVCLRKQAGFSLVEALVAIGILLMALAGPLTIAARGVFAAGVARDQVTAYFLAQEAVEYVRAVRDGNGLSALGTTPSDPAWWIAGLDSCQSTYCRVDARLAFSQGISACSSTHESCDYMKLDNTTDPNNPFYQYQTGTLTSFKRSVHITDVPGSTDEKKVTVRVSWTTGGLSKSVSLSEHLNNWQAF